MSQINGVEKFELNNNYIFTYVISCEKDIYSTQSVNPNTETTMFIGNLDHSVSFENALAAREIQLENLLDICKSDQKTIMSNISPKEKENILEKVFAYKLTPKVENFAKEYEKIYGKRSNFLWKWLGVVYKDSGVALSTVDPKLLESATENKIIFTMLFSILDDVSEFYKDEKLMDQLLGIISNNKKIETTDEKVLIFQELWEQFCLEIKKYPKYEELKEMFDYDLNQMINSVRFSYLMNQKPEYMNLKEMEVFGSFNMIVFILNGIDLMASPDFDKKDLPHLRTVFWNAQRMARIGNWLSTWKREIKEQDFSSGVFAYALSKNVICANDLKTMDEKELITRIEKSSMFEYFTDSWKEKYDKILQTKNQIKSVDMNKYIKGLETLIKLHLASEGLK